MAHRLTWEKPGSSELVFRHLIVMALNRSAVAAIVQSSGGEYSYVANLPDCWHVPPDCESPDDALVFGDELSSRLAEVKGQALESGMRSVFEESTPSDRFFEFTVESVPVGGETYILTTIAEMTAERRREQMLHVLLREVSHRSKNLLAIILSITTQTAKGSPSLPSFLRHFRGRIFSLSQSQDLVTDRSWRGAKVRELVRAQAGKYVDNDRDMLSFDGLDPLLDPNQALHIGLALHELFVDAISLNKEGHTLPHVLVSCVDKPYKDVPGIELTWRQEHVGSADGDTGDEADEFRSTVLRRVTPLAIGGQADISMDTGSLVYTLRFPHKEHNV